MSFAALVVLGYLLGSCPWGYWVVRLVAPRGHPQGRLRQHRRHQRLADLRPLARRAGRAARRAQGLRARAARDAVRLAAPSLRASSPEPPRCSGTGGRCSSGSRRAGRWSPLAAASSSASRSWVALTAGARLARRLRDASAMRRSPRSSPASRCRSAPTCTAIRPRSSSSGSRPPRRSSSCIAPTSRRLRSGRRAASISGARRMRKALVARRRSRAALWLAPGALASGWCGGADESATDRPDIVTPSRCTPSSRFPPTRPTRSRPTPDGIADDVTSMLTWWQGQDPTRVPRFDQATFGGGNCLDISLPAAPEHRRRVRRRSAPTGCSRRSASAIALTGSRYKDYLVYYDGPSVQTNVCGVGGTQAFNTGPGFAIVLLAGLPGRADRHHRDPRAAARARGGAPGDPHACPGDSGHPCDSPTDVLYPFASGDPLSSLVLDFNHDDYYGALRVVAGHPGLALAAPPRRAGGRPLASRSRAPGRSRATCPGSTARRAARRSGIRARS